MTRIDFYVLPDVDELARQRFTCRLAARAAWAGKRVHVRATAATAPELDALMWNYPTEQFLPHARLEDACGRAPVTIGAADAQPAHEQVLINLGDDVPGFFGRFERVAEIVLATNRAGGRAKYRHYRDRGYPLFHHELDAWE